MRSPKLSFVAVFLLLVAGSDTAVASPISYSFTGLIDSSSSPAVSVGDPIVGSFVYDPDAPMLSATPSFIRFEPTVATISATVGGSSFLAVSPFVAEDLSEDFFTSEFPFPAGVYDDFVLSSGLLSLGFLDADATFFNTFTGRVWPELRITPA